MLDNIIKGVNQVSNQVYKYLCDEKANNILAKIAKVVLAIISGPLYVITTANNWWHSVTKQESDKIEYGSPQYPILNDCTSQFTSRNDPREEIALGSENNSDISTDAPNLQQLLGQD